jgi:hypothetical protein
MHHPAQDHQRFWEGLHGRIKEFFTSGVTSYRDTSANQNYIGAEAMAFDRLMLPLQETKGPGEVVWRQLLCTAPQVYVTQTPIVTGIPGIATGQMFPAGLTDNPFVDQSLNQEIV